MGNDKKVVTAAAVTVLAVLGTSPFWKAGPEPVPGQREAQLTAVAVAPEAPSRAFDVHARGSVEDPSRERQNVPVAPPAPTRVPASPQPLRAPPVPMGGILVTVVDGSGQPAGEGHAVLCRALPGPGRVVVSDRAALARFPDLPVGDYQVCTADMRQRKVAVIAGAMETVTLQLGSGVKVTGSVVDAKGRPVPHAEILMRIGAAWPAWPFPVGRADGRGRFEVLGATQMQSLFARDERLGTTPGHVLMQNDLAAPPCDIGELRFRSVDLGVVRGHVVDAVGIPVARAWVQLNPPPDAQITLHATDEEGRFESIGVPVGRCRLYVYSKGYAPHRSHLQLAANSPAEVEIVLCPGATVRGIVRDVLRQPIAGAYVRAEGLTYPQHFYQQTGADGTFRFDDVGVGTFKVAAWQKEVSRQLRELQIDGPGAHELEIVLADTDSIHGRLVDARGAPLQNWFVARPKSGRWTATDADGRFVVVECKPAGNELQVRPNEAKQLVHATFAGLRPGPDEQVLVVGDDQMPSAVIRGQCLDKAGRALAGVSLEVRIADRLLIDVVRTGADGSFELGPVPPGKYRIHPVQLGHDFPLLEVEVVEHQHLLLAPIFDRD